MNSFSYLKLAVVGNHPELRKLYETAIEKHNNTVFQNHHYNAGFDLFFPEETKIKTGFASTMLSMKVKCEMTNQYNDPLSFYMYPRSSISKTPLMLANHVGIIDSGYRGEMIGAFRCFVDNYTVEKHNRLLQICHPKLEPFIVKLVDESELSETERGEGGFGSTGK